MIVVDESTPIVSAELHFSGRLRLRQRGLLPASGRVNTYNVRHYKSFDRILMFCNDACNCFRYLLSIQQVCLLRTMTLLPS